ncbi:MAG: site-specific integrase [Methanocella sp.]
MNTAKAENRFHATDTMHDNRREREVSSAVKDQKITEDDAVLIREFISEVIATRHIVPKRAYKLAYVLVGWRRYIGPFRANTIGDIYQGIEKFHRAGFKTNTLTDYDKFLKRFYLWMIENKYSSISEVKIRKISVDRVDSMTKTAEDLISEDQVKQMIDACQNSKDRALISMLNEGAFRVGELGNLTWGQVKFSEYNITVNVDDKTGKPRMVPLYKSIPYISAWRQDYPADVTSETYVFITRQGRQMQYQGLVKQLNKIAERAGIEKHLTPHTFRHSTITRMIKEGVSESVIKLMCWGTVETDQFKTYAHLTAVDIEKEMAAYSGVVTPEQRQKSKTLEPRQCPRCYAINTPDQEYCGKCGLPLTDLATGNQDGLMKFLYAEASTNPQVAEAIRIISEAALKNKQ